MQSLKVVALTAIGVLLFSGVVSAQDKTEGIEIHKNVTLFEMPMMMNLFADAAKQFQPIFREALTESTTDQPDSCALTVRIAIGVKEVGAAKIKRPMAHIVAYRRNSREEFVGDFILYSFLRSGPVNKEETIQFLKKQILVPSECR